MKYNDTLKLIPNAKRIGKFRRGQKKIRKPSHDSGPIRELVSDIDEENDYSSYIVFDKTAALAQYDRSAAILFKTNRKYFFSIVGGNADKYLKINLFSMLKRPVRSRQDYTRLGVSKGFQPDINYKEKILCSTHQKRGKLIAKRNFALKNGRKINISDKKISTFIEGQNDTNYDSISEADINQAEEIAEISEVDLFKNNSLMFLCLKDNTIKNEKGKRYQYGVEIEVVTSFKKYIKNTLNKFDACIANLQDYLFSCSSPNAFDHDLEEYKSEFVSSYHRQIGYDMIPTRYGASVQGSPPTENIIWLYAPVKFLRLHKLISNDAPKKQAKEIYNSLNLLSGSPERIQQVINSFISLRQQVSKLYDINVGGSNTQNDGSNNKKSIRNSRKKEGVHKIRMYSDNTVSIQKPKKMGLKFMPIKKKKRMAFLSKKAFKKRMIKEKSKFFKGKPQLDKSSNILSKDIKALENIDINSSIFFSPMAIKINNVEKDTSSGQESMFDDEFFTSFSLIKGANFKKNIQEEDLIHNAGASSLDVMQKMGISFGKPMRSSLKRKEVEIDDFTDAKDYLGDDSTFLPPDINLNKLISLNKVLLKEKKKSIELAAAFVNIKNKKITKKQFKINDFNVKSKKSKIKAYMGKGKMARHLAHLPMQIKALMLSDTNAVKFPILKMDFDPLSNPNTSEAFKQNFLNIRELHYFDGFGLKANGMKDLNSPQWKKMNSAIMDKRPMLLCKLKCYENETLEIKADETFPNTNSVFLMGDE